MTDTASRSTPPLTRKDFVSDQEVRWCPGCGDYAILAQMQRVLPELGIPREKIVFISGIGCSSRFPYYMNTYGVHSIHGRAPTLATGLNVVNPDLQIWVITGDGDGLSIGGNHLLHCLRRNVNLRVLLFNNRIYGLTKGQYSPTSLPGHKTKTSPLGSIEQSFNAISVALAAEGTFVARTVDVYQKHLAEILKRAAQHRGTAFVEIFQNCIVYNPNEWDLITEPSVRDDHVLHLEHGKPMIFGRERNKGIRLRGLHPEIVTLGEDGMALITEEEDYVRIPTVARSVYDVSGAGDTVTAVVAVALAAGATVPEAAILANHAAGIEVGKAGVASVSADELREAVHRYQYA